MICTSCNRDFDRKQLTDGLCRACLNYFNEGGEINPLPEPGTIDMTTEVMLCVIFAVRHIRNSEHTPIKCMIYS